MKPARKYPNLLAPRARVVEYPDGSIAAIVQSTGRSRFSVLVDIGYVVGGQNIRDIVEIAARPRKRPLSLRQWATELGQTDDRV